MNDLIPKNKTVRFAAAAALFGMLLYLGGLLVVSREIKKVESLYNDTQSKSSEGEKFWAIKSVAEANQVLIQSLMDFLIKKGDEVKFIEQIETVARASAVKFEITSIDVKNDQKDPLKEDVGVKIAIEGSWKNIMFFIDKLERMPFGVSINRTELYADVPGHWSGSIEFIVFREK